MSKLETLSWQVLSLQAGYFDYWYFFELKGNITSDSIQTNDQQSGLKFDLKPGFWVNINAVQRQTGQNSTTNQLEIYVSSQGTDQIGLSDYTY